MGIGIPVISAIRRSVIHTTDWAENFAYSHRTRGLTCSGTAVGAKPSALALR